jgi:cyclic-di-GMP-binding protein
MPSFDIVSKINMHEITNAIDQSNREITSRFDFKDTNAKFEFKDNKATLTAQNNFQLKQMLSILEIKCTKRGIDIRCLKINDPQESLHEAKQLIDIKQGIDQETAKKITKFIKDSKVKTQTAIQGEQIRVTGKKRDDLQVVITMLREQKLDLPLQYENFRD